uniref:Uncharacterized protein n=1 Tax=Oryza meridionalis TaxID=40149 RepID=A0A0E0C2A6_9ORYZ
MVAATTTTTATAVTVAAATTTMMTSGGRRLAVARRAGGVGPRGRAGAGQGCMAAGQRRVGASAQELYAVVAASESATRSTGPAMVAPEYQPKVQLQASFTHLSMSMAGGWCGSNVTTGMRASGLQDPVALVSIGGWSPNQGAPQLAIILNPSLRRRWGLCPGWPYWAVAMGLSDLTLSTLTGSRQVEPRGKSMGTAIDGEPTAIDLFNELHCSKTKGFSEPVKKAIEDKHAREALTSPSVEDGQQAKTSIEAVSKQPAAKTTNVMKEIQVELDAKKLEYLVLQEELERLKTQAQENYHHSINDDVLWWSQKLVSDPPFVMTAISSLQVDSDRKQTVIVIIYRHNVIVTEAQNSCSGLQMVL